MGEMYGVLFLRRLAKKCRFRLGVCDIKSLEALVGPLSGDAPPWIALGARSEAPDQ